MKRLLATLLLALPLLLGAYTATAQEVKVPNSDWTVTPSSPTSGENVTIKYTGNQYVKDVKLTPLPTKVTITPSCLTMLVGEEVTLSADIYPDIDGVDKTVTWNVITEDDAVSFDATTGKVKAEKEGSATITVTTKKNTKTDALTITVKPQGNYYVAKAFTVGEGKTVAFSKGNLQYQPSSNTWRFADKQYTLLDNNTSSHTTTSYTPTSEDWIDLFGWGMWLDEITDKAKITNTSTTSSQYAPALTDDKEFAENHRTVGGEQWLTLSNAEWYYLMNTRTNASKLRGVATVNGVNGLIILPDAFEDPKPDGVEFTSGVASGLGRDYYKTMNEYTEAQWVEMEKSGAVFLPAAGNRDGTSVSDVGFYGLYWSSTAGVTDNARFLRFYSVGVLLDRSRRCDGRSVRLVRSL